jgi:GNAT superfamily N-acetyltransferase
VNAMSNYNVAPPQGPPIAGLVREDRTYTIPDVRGPWLSFYVTPQGHWRISKVYVPADMRGQGYGRQLLAAVCLAADCAGVTLNLTVEPERGGLRKRELRAWYQRMGFVSQAGDDYMERQPEGYS